MATTTFNDLITFSRGSNATVTGPNGLIQWAPNNLLTNSESFEASAWSKFGQGAGVAAVVTANAATAPDGTVSADRVQLNCGGSTSNDRSIVSQSLTVANGVTHTGSVWIKAASAGEVGKQLRFYGDFLLTSTIITLTADWQRVTPSSAVAATSSSVNFGIETRGTFTANQTADFFIWGAQLELGSTATTYNNTSVRNLLGFSEAFDNAAWSKTSCSIVTGAQANPVNGLFNAQKLMEDTTNAEHIVRVNIALPTITGVVYGYSVYAKAAGRTQIRVTDNNVVGATFTLSGTGSTSNISGGVTASISQLADGWYRCFISVAAASVNGRLALYLVSSGNTTYTGDGNSGVYIYGAQLSNSASLDPYVPTPGAAPSSTAYYGPRFDYDPVTLLPRGLLIEEQRTNLLLRSEEFGNVYWSPTGVTVTSNSIASPDGAVTADTLVEDTSTGVHRVFATPSCSASTTYTFSAYVKAAGRTQVRLLETTLGGAFFDLSAVTVITTDPGVTASIANVGNGWFRCRVTSTTGVAQILYVAQIQGSVAANNTYTGSGAAALYVWGAQLEAGAFATSYIPTIASTVTRSADVATITGSLFSQWYNGAEGSFVASFTAAQNTFTTYIAASNGVVAQNSMHMDNDGSGNMRVAYYSGSSAVALLSLGTIGAVGTVNTLSTAYQANNFAASRNGGTVVSDTAGAVPVGVNRLNIGADPSGAAVNVSNGHIRSIRYVPVRAADFQLQQVTT
jgi:hypothetical protein